MTSTLFGPAALPALPLEIMEEIIDLLALHKDFLLPCSLVSSAWRSRALHHLFHSVTLYEQSELDAIAALLAANPALAKHIHDIGIYYHILNIYTLPTLQNVERLRMLCLHFTQDTTSESFIRLVGARFPHVSWLDSVYLDFSSHPTDVSMRLLTTAFPLLRRVCLAGNNHSSSTTPSVDRSFPACRIRKLSLLGEQSVVLHYLADPRWNAPALIEDLEYSQRRVRTLNDPISMAELYAPYSNALSKLLNAAVSLHRLRIITMHMGDMVTLLQGVAPRVDFTAHSALRTFTLVCSSVHDQASFPETIALVALIRAMRRPRNLGEVTLLLGDTDEGKIDDSFWREILCALGPLPSPGEIPVELVLQINDNVHMIPSLDALEGLLVALARG